MSQLEDRIKELQRQLALKEAYLSVSFSFPKGNKIPNEIKEQVTLSLKEKATQLASEEEEITKPNTSEFSDIEVEVLKQLADQVLKRPKREVQKVDPPSVTPETPYKASSKAPQKFATVVSLKGIPKEFKPKVGVESRVRIKKLDLKERKAIVVDDKGFAFPILVDNLIFEEEALNESI